MEIKEAGKDHFHQVRDSLISKEYPGWWLDRSNCWGKMQPSPGYIDYHRHCTISVQIARSYQQAEFPLIDTIEVSY